MQPSLTISRLADAAGVHVETIRYYQRRGLMSEPERELGSVRRYSEADVDQLRFIKRAQTVGFTLAEIQALIEARYSRSCKATRTLAAEKLEAVEQRIKDLSHLRRELLHWIAQCDANSKSACCPTLDALEARPPRPTKPTKPTKRS